MLGSSAGTTPYPLCERAQFLIILVDGGACKNNLTYFQVNIVPVQYVLVGGVDLVYCSTGSIVKQHIQLWVGLILTHLPEWNKF